MLILSSKRSYTNIVSVCQSFLAMATRQVKDLFNIVFNAAAKCIQESAHGIARNIWENHQAIGFFESIFAILMMFILCSFAVCLLTTTAIFLICCFSLILFFTASFTSFHLICINVYNFVKAVQVELRETSDDKPKNKD